MEAKLVFGWIIDDEPFTKWCNSKKINIEQYMFDPTLFKDDIPLYIDIKRVCPSKTSYYKWSIHINHFTGTLESIQTLPPFLVYCATEFVNLIQTKSAPRFEAFLHYSDTSFCKY